MLMKRTLLFIFCCWWVLPVWAGEAELAYSNEWLKLLHYKQNVWGGYRGLVNNEQFYVSVEGINNPKAELLAEVADFNGKGGRKCDFPARFNWLKSKGLVHGDLLECSEYQRFIKDVQPSGITVLFTNAYMSNPASLFGHTLVRIDTARKGTQMLAHGSNFGADSGSEYGFAFAFKGLFGFYDGVYNVTPYWDIINTYNNIENRDIWEYNLNLSDEEKMIFVNHLYEMQKAKITYYFLSKNCSYLILELIEAVKPELELTDEYRAWVIPLDTLKTINKVSNLVKSENYRPAQYTRLLALIDKMNKRQYNMLLKIIKEKDYVIDELSDEEKSVVLEAVYQYYRYMYFAGNIELKKYRKSSFAVLRQRSRLPIVKEENLVGENPVQSHDSFRIAVVGGQNRGRSFEEIELRPAYTALSDSSFGLIKGAEVSAFASSWRYYNQEHKIVLHNFTPLKIKSLVSTSRLFKPISYATGVEIKRDFNPQNDKEGYIVYGYGGIGRTYVLPLDFWIYGMLKINGAYGGLIAGNNYGGLAPEVGILRDFGRVRIYGVVENTWATRKFGNRLVYKAISSVSLGRNLSFDVKYEASHNRGGRNTQEWLAGFRYSF